MNAAFGFIKRTFIYSILLFFGYLIDKKVVFITMDHNKIAFLFDILFVKERTIYAFN